MIHLFPGWPTPSIVVTFACFFPHQLTDITFLVGDTREPVCAVRAVLAARSFFGDNGVFDDNDNN